MRNTLIAIVVCACWGIPLHAQTQADSASSNVSWNAGLAISPQILFVGGLDLGAFTNLEYRPFGNAFTTLVGAEVRNKWLHLNVSNSGLATRSLSTAYSISAQTHFGLGYTLPTKQEEVNAFYLTATPYLFSFKETAETAFINNTAGNTSLNFNVGITWSNTKTTKSGRTMNFQFYLPILGSAFLDELRTMSFRIGLSL